jgi:hypothetical protein
MEVHKTTERKRDGMRDEERNRFLEGLPDGFISTAAIMAGRIAETANSLGGGRSNT